VLGKTLRVLGHAELIEPVRNLFHRGHQGPSWPDRGLDLANRTLRQDVWHITLV
jgi:hypothetical protein